MRESVVWHQLPMLSKALLQEKVTQLKHTSGMHKLHKSSSAKAAAALARFLNLWGETPKRTIA